MTGCAAFPLQKMARVVGELQRFQAPFALTEVPELQSYLVYELDSLKIGHDAQSLCKPLMPGGEGGGV